MHCSFAERFDFQLVLNHQGRSASLRFTLNLILRRQHGETMKHWASRFALAHLEVREVLNAANIKSTETLLRETFWCILLAETSVLTSSEFASMLATSDTTRAEGESSGNNWKFNDLVETCKTQWSDLALASRAKAGKQKQLWRPSTVFDLTGFPKAASSIDHTMNWDDVTQYRAESDRDK